VLVVYLATAALPDSPGFYETRGDSPNEAGADLLFTTSASRFCFQVFLGYILSNTCFVLWCVRAFPIILLSISSDIIRLEVVSAAPDPKTKLN
jgi:hypothetical protein